MRGNGIGSCGIPVHLHQSLNQVALFRGDPLGCVDGQQGCQAVIDVLVGQSEVEQLLDRLVVQN